MFFMDPVYLYFMVMTFNWTWTIRTEITLHLATILEKWRSYIQQIIKNPLFTHAPVQDKQAKH